MYAMCRILRICSVHTKHERWCGFDTQRIEHMSHKEQSTCVRVAYHVISKALLGIQEDRQWALRRGLEEINKEIEAASRSGVASCWFPMGTRNERIIRLAAKEASLLNSR